MLCHKQMSSEALTQAGMMRQNEWKRYLDVRFLRGKHAVLRIVHIVAIATLPHHLHPLRDRGQTSQQVLHNVTLVVGRLQQDTSRECGNYENVVFGAHSLVQMRLATAGSDQDAVRC